MSAYPLLFSPGRIGGMEVKNRVVMSPMVLNYGDELGRVTDKYLAHIERIARGGAGMLILEASYIAPAGKGFSNELGMHADGVIPGLRLVAETAHEHGAVVGPQLFHAGRQTSAAVTGMTPVAPSALPDPTINEIPRELSVAEIRDIVQDFAKAALRAQEAGCDFVEIHGAHGYLITQFLSPFSNCRTDAYGGDDEKRLRLLVEVVEAVRLAVGTEFPISVRLSGEEQVPHGLTLEDTIRIARRLEALRVDALHISAGNYASYELGYMIQPMAMPDAPLIPLAEGVKHAVDIPVLAVGKIRTPALAEEILNAGQADFIALGRPLLADADWPLKAQQGRADDINRCIACNQGCISRLFDNQDVWCTVNPATAREEAFAQPFPPRGARVVVIGGGPAGMEAAKVAAERGHRVTLFEQEDHLGGQLIAAATAPYRPGWRELHDFLLRELARLPVDVRLNTKATPSRIEREQADTAIIAIGSSPVRMKIPGSDVANVITARDLLEGTVQAHGRVVVAGGGCAGAQTAEYLATQGYAVTIVEMLGTLAADSPGGERELLLGRLRRLGVAIQMDTRILRIEEGSIAVQRSGALETIPADTVVLCLGSVPNDHLADALRAIVPQVLLVGDAVKARKVTDAMADGALAGLHIQQAGEMGAAA